MLRQVRQKRVRHPGCRPYTCILKWLQGFALFECETLAHSESHAPTMFPAFSGWLSSRDELAQGLAQSRYSQNIGPGRPAAAHSMMAPL